MLVSFAIVVIFKLCWMYVVRWGGIVFRSWISELEVVLGGWL